MPIAPAPAPTADLPQDKRAAGRRKKADDEKALARYRKWFAEATDASRDNHANYVEDTAFASSNDHFSAEVKKLRGAHRPTLTLNRSHVVIKLIVGDYRQNKLAVKVLPANGEADEDTADLYAGLIRNTEAASNADMAYVNALECAARGGFGYFRILPEYAGEDTLRQELAIRPIFNPLTVQFDPRAKLHTRADARYCVVSETVPKDDFEAQHPGASTASFDALDSGDRLHWLDGDSVRIAEVFEKEDQQVRVVAFASGWEAVIESDEQLDALLELGETVQAERNAVRTRVRWSKVTATEVLSSELLPIPYIPIIPVLGEEVNVEGKTLLRGALYYSKDAARMISYWNTAATETVALAPKARTMMTPEQYEGNEDSWNPASPTNVALYNGGGEAQGQPPPQPISPPAQPVGEMAMAQGAEQQFKATTGVYDPQLGNRPGSASGVAINSLQRQGESTSFLWVDNLRKAIEHGGRILVAWYPHVLDTERVARVLDVESNPKTVVLNQRQRDPLSGVTRILNALAVGRYDVVVSSGPAVANQRQELLAALQQILPALPIVGQVAPDLIIKALPVQGADEIAERVKRALPPQITEDPDDGGGQQQAQQVQQAQAQQQQQMQQQAMQAEQQLAQGKVQSEQAKLQLERTQTAGDLEVQQGELALKRQELAVKQLELQITRAELMARAFPGDGASAPPA